LKLAGRDRVLITIDWRVDRGTPILARALHRQLTRIGDGSGTS
jgi:hypothetical protein